MKILVTAGATWIRLDDIRIITNRFTGKTGLYLAQELKKRGHSVTLLVNPHCLCLPKGIKANFYKYFDEFKKEVVAVLKKSYFDAIIHTAAVSDYNIKNSYKGKISSGKGQWRLLLVPTEKIIKIIRKKAKLSLLIQFKLESKSKGLIDRAYASLCENKSNFVVANALEDLEKGFRVYLIDTNKKAIAIRSKKAFVDILERVINSFQG